MRSVEDAYVGSLRVSNVHEVETRHAASEAQIVVEWQYIHA